MPTPGPKPLTALGFLAILNSPQHGVFGGYLVVGPHGRPLEFHCTAPVKPNRAQEILYGPTLLPYLYGEQIGATLLAKSKVSAQIVLVDELAALALREQIDAPVAALLANDADAARLGFSQFDIGEHCLAVSPAFATDQTAITRTLAEVVARLDLAEPFTRIHEAIREAGKAA